jgi:plastocyanin
MSYHRALRSLKVAVLIGSLMAIGASCSNSTGNSGMVPAHNVLIVQGAQTKGSAAISPSTYTVSLAAGGKVVWANGDYMGDAYGGSGTTHHLVSNAPLFDTGDIAPLNSAQFVFTSTGTFGYHCSIHPSMTGTIKVNP